MDIVELTHSLELDDDGVIDDYVCRVLADYYAVIPYGYVGLLCRRQARFSELVHQCVFIYFPRNPTPSVFETASAHRIMRSAS
jgi:hypothetical protein